MKLLKTLLLVSLLTLSTRADVIVSATTAGAATAMATNGITVSEITVTASTTNNTTVRFFDSASLTTYVQAAHVTYATYNTNYDVVWTNAGGVLLTNTFVGVATLPTSVTLATNTIPALYTTVIPASASRTRVVRIKTMRGLVVVANQSAIVEVEYTR